MKTRVSFKPVRNCSFASARGLKLITKRLNFCLPALQARNIVINLSLVAFLLASLCSQADPVKTSTAKAVDPIYNPLVFRSLPGISKHFCHMGSVYVGDKVDGQVQGPALIWNYDKAEPLRCSDFEAYVTALKQRYKSSNDKAE